MAPLKLNRAAQMEIETNVYWHPAGTNPHGTTAADIGAVPTTRTINNKALSANITLAAADLPDYAEQITNADFNNLTNVGFYVVAGGTVKNAPASGSYFSLIVLKSSNRANTYVNYVQQIAIKENTYETYIRYKTTEWLPWKKMISESGGTMTGILTAQSNTSYTTRQVHNTIVSTEDPSGGSNGDIWIKYKV